MRSSRSNNIISNAPPLVTVTVMPLVLLLVLHHSLFAAVHAFTFAPIPRKITTSITPLLGQQQQSDDNDYGNNNVRRSTTTTTSSSTSSSPYLNDLTSTMGTTVDEEFATLVQQANDKRIASLRDASASVVDEQQKKDNESEMTAVLPAAPELQLEVEHVRQLQDNDDEEDTITWMGGEAAIQAASAAAKKNDQAIRRAERLALDAIRDAEEEIRQTEQALLADMETNSYDDDDGNEESVDVVASQSDEVLPDAEIVLGTTNNGKESLQDMEPLHSAEKEDDYSSPIVKMEARVASAGKGHNNNGDDDDDNDDDDDEDVSSVLLKDDMSSDKAVALDSSHALGTLPFASTSPSPSKQQPPEPATAETTVKLTTTTTSPSMLLQQTQERWAKREEELSKAERLADKQLKQVERELRLLKQAEARETKLREQQDDAFAQPANVLASLLETIAPPQDVVTNLIDKITPPSLARQRVKPQNDNSDVVFGLEKATRMTGERVNTALASLKSVFDKSTATTIQTKSSKVIVVAKANTNDNAPLSMLSETARSVMDYFNSAVTNEPKRITPSSSSSPFMSSKAQSVTSLISANVFQEAATSFQTTFLDAKETAGAFLFPQLERIPFLSVNDDDAIVTAASRPPKSKPPPKLWDSTAAYGKKLGKPAEEFLDRLRTDASTKQEGVALLLNSTLKFGIDQVELVRERFDTLREGMPSSRKEVGAILLDSAFKFGAQQGKRVQEYVDQQLQGIVTATSKENKDTSTPTLSAESGSDGAVFFAKWD